jgi:hypothetical protein
VTLEDVGDGAMLTLVHSNVPEDQKSYEEGGWRSNYFEPMQIYFGRRRRQRLPKSGSGNAETERVKASKRRKPITRKATKKKRSGRHRRR